MIAIGAIVIKMQANKRKSSNDIFFIIQKITIDKATHTNHHTNDIHQFQTAKISNKF
jgi:hypothetical protein